MRRTDRQIVDIAAIQGIVEKAKVLHLGLWDGECPYVVPLHYGYTFKDGAFIFYMHSATEGHKLDLIRRYPCVCVELECDVALVSGGEIACKYGAAYASVIGRGQAEIVEDEQEKISALRLLMQNQTGRNFEISAQMADTVAVIKATIPSFTAKSRPMPL